MISFKELIEGINKPKVDINLLKKFISKNKKELLNREVTIYRLVEIIEASLDYSIGYLDVEYEIEVNKDKGLGNNIVISGSYDNADEVITIYLNYSNIKINIDNILWNYILEEVPKTIKHEVLHWQQSLKREKDGFINPKSKKYIVGNLGHSDEIEAYASDAAEEIYKKYRKNSIKALSNIKEVIKYSNALNDFYKHRKNKTLWNKFLKKLKEYLDDLV